MEKCGVGLAVSPLLLLFTIRDLLFTLSLMSIYEDDLRPLDTSKVQTYLLSERPSKVSQEDFARIICADSSLKDFLDSLPNILAVKSLRAVAEQINRARDLKRPIIWGIGGHVVKTGLAPILIDLMKRGYVSAIAANGSVLIHDAEIALVGSTSEDVDASLNAGAFGGARETGTILNEAARVASQNQIGLGEATGKILLAHKPEQKNLSLLCAAYEHKIPFTAHVAIGADITHFHPETDGASLGAASHTDFRLFAEMVRRLDRGGVYLNVGSAVVLPEVFLKAVTLVHNLNFPLADFTTANFDFIQSYRPQTNVVRRPVQNGAGRSYSLTGHHEIMIPLLAAAIIIAAPNS